MARLQLNKSSLARETTQLKTYRRFLPSLDLKRRQLMAAAAAAETALTAAQAAVEDIAARVGRDVPMLANEEVSLDGLARLKGRRTRSENMVGVALPVLAEVDVEIRPYDALAKPHWVDDVARLLTEMLRARLEVHVAQRRAELLRAALATVTQRVNLFEQVLIPRTEHNIKRIRIHLNEEAMSAVVRSKIAKRKRAAP
ncbi:MAG: V-type ATP synthase subunit D [Pseudomonadota bacterium]